MKKKNLMALGITAVVGIAAAGTGVYAYNNYPAYNLKAESVNVELGQEMSLEASTYVTGSDRAVEGTKINLTSVDTTKVGNYPATASYDDKSLSFTVQVSDTTAPSVVLSDSSAFQLVEGEILAATDIVSKMDDLAGIASVTFADAETRDTSKDDLLAAISLSYEKEGDYNNTIIVTDVNGNEFKQDFTIHVTADYTKHVSGFQDWTVEVDSKVDFTKGIKKDERITSVTPKTDSVDLSKVGKYTLVYDIAGDDNKTVIQHSVTVKVVEKEVKQESTTETTTNTKESVSSSSSSSKGSTGSSSSSSKESVSSSSSSSKGSTGSSSSSSKGSTGSSSSSKKNNTSSSSSSKKDNTSSSSSSKKDNTSSSSSSELKPGDVLDFGDPTGSVKINGGYGYDYDTLTVGK